MSIAVLKEITSIEEQAEQIEVQAQQKAREIVASAKKDASAVIEKAIEQAEAEAKMIVKASQEKASRDMSEMKASIHAQCHEIKENSEKKLEDTVNYIVGRIVNHDR